MIFGGDCHLINEFLETKSEKSIFGLLQYFNSLLRSFGHVRTFISIIIIISIFIVAIITNLRAVVSHFYFILIFQVIFANNPISGLIILAAIGTADYKAMFAALLTSSLAFLFAKILQQDILGNLNGFFGYNAVLHAVVSVGYLPTLYESIDLDEPRFWLFLIFVTLISVYFTSAFANLFRYLWHYPIPCFTIPFNVLQYVLIFCLLNNSIPPRILSSHLLEPRFKYEGNQSEVAIASTNENSTVNLSYVELSSLQRRHAREKVEDLEESEIDQNWSPTDFDRETETSTQKTVKNFSNGTHLNWGETFSGTIIALSQVYGLKDIPCSILMFLALIVYSPTTALFCYIGSFFGTLVGIFLSSDFEKVYNGIWGYNGLLCGGALAGFGFVLTAQSAFLALIAVLFCTVFQHFITPLFDTVSKHFSLNRFFR